MFAVTESVSNMLFQCNLSYHFFLPQLYIHYLLFLVIYLLKASYFCLTQLLLKITGTCLDFTTQATLLRSQNCWYTFTNRFLFPAPWTKLSEYGTWTHAHRPSNWKQGKRSSKWIFSVVIYYTITRTITWRYGAWTCFTVFLPLWARASWNGAEWNPQGIPQGY